MYKINRTELYIYTPNDERNYCRLEQFNKNFSIVVKLAYRLYICKNTMVTSGVVEPFFRDKTHLTGDVTSFKKRNLR